MHLWNEIVQRERYNDLLREAELHRLVHGSQNERAAGLWGRAMVWLGGRLIALGQRLQMPYRCDCSVQAEAAVN